MLKSMIVFIAVLAILVFALANAHHIELHFMPGNPVDVRAAYLVLFSYVLGVLSASYFFVMSRFNARKKARLQEESEDEDDEDEI